MIGIDCRLIDTKNNSGISRYTEFLIEYYISKYADDKIVLITNDASFNYKNCRIHFTKLRPYGILDFLFFNREIAKIGISYFHSPFYSSFFFKVPGVKSIVTVHDLMYKLVPDFFGKNTFINFTKIKYFDFIVYTSLKNADLVISISQTTKSDVKKLYGIDSIHIPEDSHLNVIADTNILKRFSLTKNKYFFYCGNSRPHKNIDFVIDAFNDNPYIGNLVLAGKSHASSDNVLAVGVVTDAELLALYENSIAFIFPSKYEGFGLPILEALHAKTKVVASKISAFLEFDSLNIYFFNYDDTSEFIVALRNATNGKFINDAEVLQRYSKENIYKLNDTAFTRFLADI
ncbi:glycosyltransferase family 1 protein [Pedobacter aquatilis]|uniref:glycosyltransferase family 4 protein n=1 Tax=Pedobacter aquatilis TaxID=351343 RepID=UPI00292D37D5|nr:glycosyltransferase family 1 protein [Pedobacter aquatilis]